MCARALMWKTRPRTHANDSASPSMQGVRWSHDKPVLTSAVSNLSGHSFTRVYTFLNPVSSCGKQRITQSPNLKITGIIIMIIIVTMDVRKADLQ